MLNQFILYQHTDKLRQLLAIGEVGSISAAAKQLGLTQPALSHSIRGLESHLKIDLLERKPRGVALTEHGQILYDLAQRFIHDLESTELKLRNPDAEESGRIRIGTHETLAIHIFPQLVNRYFCLHPNLLPSMTSGRIDALVQGVLDQRYDIVLTVEPFKHEDLCVVPLYEGRIDFFIGTRLLDRYAHLNKPSLTIDEAGSLPLLTDVEAHTRQGLPLPQALASLGLSLRNLFELNSFEASMRLAAEGAGIAIVADRNAQHLVKAKKLRRLRFKGISKSDFGRYRICATYLKKNQKRKAIQDLVELLVDAF